MLGQLKRTGGASWRLRGGRHLLASKRFGEDEACRLREIWFWGVWAREGERGGWLKSAADCQGGGMAWARALGPGVLRCAAHAAHCLVGIRTRAGVCANAALHCNNQSMHGGRRSRVGARVQRVQPLHTILRGPSLQDLQGGCASNRTELKPVYKTANHHQHDSDLTVITHNASKSSGVHHRAFCCFFLVTCQGTVPCDQCASHCVFDTKSLDQMAEIL